MKNTFEQPTGRSTSLLSLLGSTQAQAGGIDLGAGLLRMAHLAAALHRSEAARTALDTGIEGPHAGQLTRIELSSELSSEFSSEPAGVTGGLR